MPRKIVSLQEFREENQHLPAEGLSEAPLLDPLDFSGNVRPLPSKALLEEEDDDDDDGGGSLRDPLEEDMLRAILYNELLEEMRAFAKMDAVAIDLDKLERRQQGELGANFSKTHPLAHKAQFSGVSESQDNPIVSLNEEAREEHAAELKYQHDLKLSLQNVPTHSHTSTPRPG